MDLCRLTLNDALYITLGHHKYFISLIQRVNNHFFKNLRFRYLAHQTFLITLVVFWPHIVIQIEIIIARFVLVNLGYVGLIRPFGQFLHGRCGFIDFAKSALGYYRLIPA